MRGISPGLRDRPSAETVLVIGVHREELAFGDQVVRGLDPSLADVLRIPRGLSGRNPRQDQRFYYETLHRELYHQLAVQIRGRYRLLLDLHCGLDESPPCADLISREPALLACVERRAAARFGETGGSGYLRSVLLEEAPEARCLDTATPARTVIPRGVWSDPTFEYVGIEVYLASPGVGQPRDRELALWLIRSVIECRALKN